MDIRKLETLPPPPGVIASLQAGFSIVSGRIVLITFPLLLDVLLWLGPRLSVGQWYEGVFNNSLSVLRQNGFPAQDLAVYTENSGMIIDLVQRLNWLAWFRTLPVGIPALMLGLPEALPVQTPLGPQVVLQLPSFVGLLAVFLGLTLAGWLSGGTYFRLVAAASLGEAEPAAGLGWTLLQTLLLSILWSLGLLAIAVPLSLLIGFLAALSPLIAQGLILVLLFFLFWLVVPLFFMPHGIFVRGQNAFGSIQSSLRLARLALPNSSLFVLSSFLLSRGLSYLWLVPANDSWLALVGIAGHAFISTALLSASFVYYRNMNHWLQTVYERFLQLKSQSSIKKV